MAPRASLTQHMRALETLATGGLAVPERFAFAGGQYTIRVANDLESRKKAYQLVYELYLEKEYAKPNAASMWLSIFDALPETTTFLVERRDGVAVGALTVVFDSPMGLPADNVYRPELDALRAAGRRIAEVVSLGVAEEAQIGSQILVKLFNFAYFVARGIRGATDFVVTVNPRHVRFYERMMLFALAGPERGYDKVGGAPAVLLRLDFDIAEEQRVPGSWFLVPGLVESSAPGTRNQEPGTRNLRSIYTQFRAVGEEPATVAALGHHLRPMTEQELGYFFVAETNILREAAPEQRAYLQGRHPARELEMAAAVEAGS
jgi:hypothetical protein